MQREPSVLDRSAEGQVSDGSTPIARLPWSGIALYVASVFVCGLFVGWRVFDHSGWTAADTGFSLGALSIMIGGWQTLRIELRSWRARFEQDVEYRAVKGYVRRVRGESQDPAV